nr:hypothetical protein [Tanacetum cinerariifolium]
MNLLQEVMDTCIVLSRRIKHLELDKIAQDLEITKLKRRVKKLEKRNKVKVLKLRRLQKVGTTERVETFNETVMDDVSNQERMIAEMDEDADVVLEEDKEVPEDSKDEFEPTEVQEVVDVVTTAKIITEVVTAASETITAAEAQVPSVTLTAAPSRRRKGVVIRDPQEKSTTSTIIPAETKFKDKGKGILMDYFKVMSYNDICPIFEAKFNTNVAFLQKTKEQIEEEESRALKRLNETLAEKAAKRQKLDEEVEELKRYLQIVPNEDDDVYIEATPLARKVLVVDYQIIELNNKPYYKIIRADDTHQLYERFSTTKPKNFFDDFLLVTLGAMFEKPDIHAQIWKNQRSVHGPAKMLNVVRLEVEEESEVSLELLRQIKTADVKCCC